MQLVTRFVPLSVWSLLWLLAAILAAASAVKPWPGGSVGCAALSFVWATGYAVSWGMSIRGFTVEWMQAHWLSWLGGPGWTWAGIPVPRLLTDGTPAGRDYLSSSVYWTVLLLLALGYVLARKALDASRILHTISEH